MDQTQNNTPDNHHDAASHSPSANRVLVTGGTGFLGAYVLKNLVEKGIPARAIRRSVKTPFFIPEEITRQIEWVEGDVLDTVLLQDAMQDVTAVIHSAAIVSFHSKDRHLMRQVNIEGTANVVNSAVENGVKRLVHVSSVAALGRKKIAEKVSENRKWEEHKHNTYYGITKHKAELEVWRGLAEGLEGVIVNPGTILGFGNWHQSSCAIFKNAYKEFPWYTKGINGFVGVEDAAEAIVQLLQSTISGKRFIINGANISFQCLFNLIADGFGKQKPHREATVFLGGIAWRLEALKSLLFGKKALLTRETARVAHSRTEFDNSALLGALPGFQYTPIETVIENACKKYLQALENGQLTL